MISGFESKHNNKESSFKVNLQQQQPESRHMEIDFYDDEDNRPFMHTNSDFLNSNNNNDAE